VIAGTVTVTLVDKVGRRPLLMMSTLGCSFSLGILGTYIFLHGKRIDVSGFEWVPLTSLILYIVIFCLGLCPLHNVILTEVFPPNVKDIAVSLNIMTSVGCFGIVTKIFQIMVDTIGAYAPFWLFSTVVFCGFIFVCFFVPETKGKRLETILEELNGM
ncbi:hypothetical protein L9F63_013213, partial [Diploptera punctata]